LNQAKQEEWKVVPSLPNVEVSSFGRVRAAKKTSRMPNGGVRVYENAGSFGQWDGTRYLYVLHGKTHKVARLICEAFNGPPQKGQVCMHLDENSRNNRPENLKWGTQKENLNAPGFLAYCRSRIGDKHPKVIGDNRRQAF
jgi:hypothetical protein